LTHIIILILNDVLIALHTQQDKLVENSIFNTKRVTNSGIKQIKLKIFELIYTDEAKSRNVDATY